MTTVVFTVRSGKNPERVSSPVTATAEDLSALGMSVVTSRIAPDGIHIMYDTLMTMRNRVDATIFPPEGNPVRVVGQVIWFRRVDRPQGPYLFGMKFDVHSPELKEQLYLE